MPPKRRPLKLAVARLWHEGNHFSPVPTVLKDFQHREWVSGPDAVNFYRGTNLEIAASIEFAETHAQDWDVHILHCCAAPPGGPIPREDFEHLRSQILAGFQGSAWDAVYLSLHGALAVEDIDRPDEELLGEVRKIVGDAFIGVSLDFHANIGPTFLALGDFVTGYRQYPHTDMKETAARCLSILTAAIAERLPQRLPHSFVKIPAIVPSMQMRTAEEPMLGIQKAAEAARHTLVDLTVFGGFAYGDSPDAGPSIIAYAATLDRANQATEAIAALMQDRLDAFYVALPTPVEAVTHGLTAAPGLIAITDPADNPLSGGIGDTPTLLRALIDHPGLPETIFAFFHDPALVEQCHRLGAGQEITCNLGGRVSPEFGTPVPIHAVIEKLTDGRFVNTGPMETGLEVRLGRTALLRHGSIQIIITETCQAPNDPGYFTLHGLDVRRARLLCVKAKNHFRASFSPLCQQIIDCDAPGPATLDLTGFPYRRVPPHYRR